MRHRRHTVLLVAARSAEDRRDALLDAWAELVAAGGTLSSSRTPSSRWRWEDSIACRDQEQGATALGWSEVAKSAALLEQRLHLQELLEPPPTRLTAES